MESVVQVKGGVSGSSVRRVVDCKLNNRQHLRPASSFAVLMYGAT